MAFAGLSVLMVALLAFLILARPGQAQAPRLQEAAQPGEPNLSIPDYKTTCARTCQKVYDQFIGSYRDGKVDIESVYLWSNRLMELQLSEASGTHGTDPDSISISAARAHLGRMKRLEEIAGDRVGKGQESPMCITTAEHYRVEAEAKVLEFDRSTADPDE